MEKSTYFECNDNNDIHILADSPKGLVVTELGGYEVILPGLTLERIDCDRHHPVLINALSNLY